VSTRPIWNPLGPQASAIEIGTSLPVSPAPIDGQEFILVDSLTAPTTTQHYRYTASVAGADKWVKLAAPAAPPPVVFPAGAGCIWFSNTPPAGYAILDGSTLTNAQTNYPALWANVDPAWKSGANIILPDCRGRMPIGKGTHADVDALGDSDGAAVGTRRVKHAHPHTLVLPDHLHADSGHNHRVTSATGTGGSFTAYTISGGLTGLFNASTQFGIHSLGTEGSFAGLGNPTTHPAIDGAIGAAGMTDGPAFIVVNWIIKLA
jgi:hypothetical protein